MEWWARDIDFRMGMIEVQTRDYRAVLLTGLYAAKSIEKSFGQSPSTSKLLILAKPGSSQGLIFNYYWSSPHHPEKT